MVSLLTPNYNHTHLLLKKLASCPELPKGYEWLICDDCSTDTLFPALEQAVASKNNIHLFRNSSNQGVENTVNFLLKKARGAYVLGASADDLFGKDLFFLTEEHCKNMPGVILTNPWYCRPEKPQDTFYVCLLPQEHSPAFFPSKSLPTLLRKTDLYFAGHCTFLRTDLARKFGGYNPTHKAFSDWYLNHRIAFEAGMKYFPEKQVSIFCIYKTSYSYSFQKDIKKQTCRLLFQQLFHLPRSVKAMFLFSGACGPIVRPLLKTALFHPRLWPYLFFLFIRKVFAHKGPTLYEKNAPPHQFNK